MGANIIYLVKFADVGKYLYHILAFAVVAIWGVTFVFTKILISEGLLPDQIFAIRFAMAYVGIWLVALLGGGRQRLLSGSVKDELIFVFLGITGGSLYFLTENTALAYTQACNVSFIVCSAPLITLLLTLLCKRCFRGARIFDALEDVRVGVPLVVGTLMALVGMALVVFSGARLKLSPAGDLLALGAALCWGAYSIFMAQMTQRYGALLATRKVFFWGLVTIIPFLLKDGLPAGEILAKADVWGSLLFLGLVASLACFFLWNKVMAELGNVTSTNYVYLNPVFTLIASMIVLGERMTVLSGTGCALILAGVVLAGRKTFNVK